MNTKLGLAKRCFDRLKDWTAWRKKCRCLRQEKSYWLVQRLRRKIRLKLVEFKAKSHPQIVQVNRLDSERQVIHILRKTFASHQINELVAKSRMRTFRSIFQAAGLRSVLLESAKAFGRVESQMARQAVSLSFERIKKWSFRNHLLKRTLLTTVDKIVRKNTQRNQALFFGSITVKKTQNLETRSSTPSIEPGPSIPSLQPGASCLHLSLISNQVALAHSGHPPAISSKLHSQVQGASQQGASGQQALESSPPVLRALLPARVGRATPHMARAYSEPVSEEALSCAVQGRAARGRGGSDEGVDRRQELLRLQQQQREVLRFSGAGA